MKFFYFLYVLVFMTSSFSMAAELTPLPSDPAPKSPIYFQLLGGLPNMTLKYISPNPLIRPNLSKPLEIEIVCSDPYFRTNPSFILQNDWPKDRLEIPISVKKAAGKDPNPPGILQFTVTAHFTYCHRTTKACAEGVSQSIHYVRP